MPAACSAALNIERKGNEEQKAAFLPKLIAGDLRMAICISEADAGSDVGGRCALSPGRNGGNWARRWPQSSGAPAPGGQGHAAQRLSEDRYLGHHSKGMSLFLIDNDAAGVEVKKLDTAGPRAPRAPNEIRFDGATVSPDRIVGGVNGGWDCILAGLQVERINIGGWKLRCSPCRRRSSRGICT